MSTGLQNRILAHSEFFTACNCKYRFLLLLLLLLHFLLGKNLLL